MYRDIVSCPDACMYGFGPIPVIYDFLFQNYLTDTPPRLFNTTNTPEATERKREVSAIWPVEGVLSLYCNSDPQVA
jgi:hypothetical protein